jgi:hypothetical protein
VGAQDKNDFVAHLGDLDAQTLDQILQIVEQLTK